MTPPRWRIRLSTEAETDFIAILQYTMNNFGARQAEVYKETLVEALATLESGPEIAGSVARDEILQGLRTLHVARHGRRGRHFMLFRAAEGQFVEIVRILHDSMDIARHIPPEIA